MKIEKLLEVAIQMENLPLEIAEEVSSYGIVELMKAGATHSEALDVLERAEISIKKNHFRKISF